MQSFTIYSQGPRTFSTMQSNISKFSKMAATKFVCMGFLVFLCLTLCTAHRVLLDPNDRNKPKDSNKLDTGFGGGAGFSSVVTDGVGIGKGEGFGSGSGSGDGQGIGSGSGYGSGSGSGHGEGDGCGSGSGNGGTGYGSGSGSGSGNGGTGYGSGSGSGSGSGGTGYGYGSGSGSGSGGNGFGSGSGSGWGSGGNCGPFNEPECGGGHQPGSGTGWVPGGSNGGCCPGYNNCPVGGPTCGIPAGPYLGCGCPVVLPPPSNCPIGCGPHLEGGVIHDDNEATKTSPEDRPTNGAHKEPLQDGSLLPNNPAGEAVPPSRSDEPPNNGGDMPIRGDSIAPSNSDEPMNGIEGNQMDVDPEMAH